MKLPSVLITALSFALTPCAGQTYSPDWLSLDTRPTPRWFKDAKFGIFIHWGVYAVPGWCSKGNYAEWYQYGLQTTDTARQNFHKRKFGDLTYYQLADHFKAELYQPDDWADLFEKSGAKYIVLTSKHHDGYTLWPSKEANASWGFPWTSVDVGPKRDLLGDLFTAVRKTSVRAGMYYSLYEWFNPLWKSDPARFAQAHTWPQMKDLIHRYQPDVFWTDGDWDATAETWKSQEFLAWLYNESPVKDKVVVNDRWGSGVRFHHGGIYTPEYQPDLDFEDHYWEESRGMGFSYGYNREEDAWDYNSTQSLVLQLVDKVSRGGNFLLDIGPDEHGKVPPIMQERLLQIGEWLSINGKAIYGTTRWVRPSQWSEGRRDHKPEKGGDLLLKLTVNPDPGFAVKEMFFTYSPGDNSLNAIFPRYPDNRQLVMDDITPPEGSQITFLSTGETLSWKQEGKDVIVALPEYNPNRIGAPYAYVIRVSGYGRYVARPVAQVSYAPGSLKPVVSCPAPTGASVFFTTDGSEPGPASTRYEKPFTVERTGVIRFRAFAADALPSAEAVVEAAVYEWLSPVKATGLTPGGWRYSYFELSGPANTQALTGSVTHTAGTSPAIGVTNSIRKENFGLRYEGYVSIASADVYTFVLTSDDGSRLWIDDQLVIDNDGLHGFDAKEGRAALRKGLHKVRVDFVQASGGSGLSLQYRRGAEKLTDIPASRVSWK
jgi:alpha-L-fucosidase